MSAEIIQLAARRQTASEPTTREPLLDPDAFCVGCGNQPATYDRGTRAWWCAGCTVLDSDGSAA